MICGVEHSRQARSGQPHSSHTLTTPYASGRLHLPCALTVMTPASSFLLSTLLRILSTLTFITEIIYLPHSLLSSSTRVLHVSGIQPRPFRIRRTLSES
jgi:hypothetical protein